ncbi:MAG TPA: hypothetical protein PL157_14390 [Acidobacteriota bacterium]|nr:hypothetical protein [Acidobacteriota bacterium]HNH83554.1 hypothetical protein [Acidobacteriota bacterium]
MPKELKIKRESLAERCEICHQSDQFDPPTGLCVRCQVIAGQLQASSVAPSEAPLKGNRRTGAASLGIIYSLFLAFYLVCLMGIFVDRYVSNYEDRLGVVSSGFFVILLSPFLGYLAGTKAQIFAERRAARKNKSLSYSVEVAWIILWSTLAVAGSWLLLASLCGFPLLFQR